jgi:hypothetical protein
VRHSLRRAAVTLPPVCVVAIRGRLRTNVMDIPDRIINTATAAVEGRGHQSDAQPDHADNAEQRRHTDLAPVVEQVEPEDVTKNDNKTYDQYNTCQRVSHDPRQLVVLGSPRALNEIHDPRHLIACRCKNNNGWDFRLSGCQVNRLHCRQDDGPRPHFRSWVRTSVSTVHCIKNPGWFIRSAAWEATVREPSTGQCLSIAHSCDGADNTAFNAEGRAVGGGRLLRANIDHHVCDLVDGLKALKQRRWSVLFHERGTSLLN